MSLPMGRLASIIADLTPHQVALLLAAGFALGTFPILGLAAVLCAIAAPLLRLNMPALQAVGQIVTPAQYALLVPLARIGAHVVPVSLGAGGAVIHAVAGWCCVCVPLGLVCYITTFFLLRRHLRHNVGTLEIAA